MKSSGIDVTNGLAGGLFVLFGIFFGIQALMLDLGSAFRMGPGYFPLVLSAILILLGAVIFLSALRADSEPIGAFAVRGMVLILAAPVLFGLLLAPLGFVPALFVTAFTASFASARMRIVTAIVISAALATFATLVFVGGLELPFMLVAPWLRALF